MQSPPKMWEDGTENMNNVINLNYISDSCRVCMSHYSDMCCIFDQEKAYIINEIEFCTGLLLRNEEGLPNKICQECLENLSVAHKFKSSCLLADSTFKNMGKSLKAELDCEVNGPNNTETMLDNDACTDFDEDSKVKEEVFNDGVEKENANDLGRLRDVRKEMEKPTKKLSVGKKKLRGKYEKKKLGNIKTGIEENPYKVDPLLCALCDLRFESKNQASVHRKQRHVNTECWLCEICGKVFVHRGSHYSHVKFHLPPAYSCDHCDYKTWMKYDMVKHMRRHVGVKQYQCESCTASFYVASNLINHIKNVHEGVRRYSCHICQKSFYEKCKLNRHVDAHNDVKRYECELCQSCFTRRCYWKKHLLRQHGVVTPRQRPGRQKNKLHA